MAFDARFINHECYIGEVARLEKVEHVFVQVGLWDLHSDV